jgi:hypothetical protein
VNLIVDSVEFLVPLISASRDWLIEGVRYEDLRDWFAGARKLDLHEVLRTLAESEEVLRDHDPWRCINRWLVIETLIRAVGKREDGPRTTKLSAGNSPFDHAWSIFLGILEGVRPPNCCRTRSTRVQDAFRRWWKVFADQLADVIRHLRDELASFCELSPNALKEHLGPTLAVRLAPQTLAGLAFHKNNQLRLCLGRRNAEIPLPESVPEPWVVEMYDRIDDCLQRRKDFLFDSHILDKLASVLAWVVELQLEEKFQVSLEVLRGIIEGALPARATHDEQSGNLPIGQLLDAWRILFDLVRARNLPPNWADHRQVEDLFRHPLMHRFEFGLWRTRMADLGLNPRT